MVEFVGGGREVDLLTLPRAVRSLGTMLQFDAAIEPMLCMRVRLEFEDL